MTTPHMVVAVENPAPRKRIAYLYARANDTCQGCRRSGEPTARTVAIRKPGPLRHTSAEGFPLAWTWLYLCQWCVDHAHREGLRVMASVPGQ